jgi:FkbM family methyltransferase
MSLSSSLLFILKHPLNKNKSLSALFRFSKWQLQSRFRNQIFKIPFIGTTQFLAKKGWTGVTGNIYCGLHEFEDMSFVLHFLGEGDLFVDIGANMGTYTILASGVRRANTIAIEPTLVTFNILQQNIELNQIDHLVNTENIGLAGSSGFLNFSTQYGTMNRVVTEKDNREVQQTKVKTLDEILRNQNDQETILLKIDVEGYETEVLIGAEQSLTDLRIKAIIIELNGSGHHYGYDENSIHQLLISHSFKPYCYNPYTRTLMEQSSFGKLNTIYIRDIDAAIQRIKNAPKFTVLGKEL